MYNITEVYYMKNNDFLEYVNQYHIKNFIVYHKTSEKLYKWFKGVYIFAFVYQFIVNIILILGLNLAKKPLESNIVTNTVIATVLMAVGFVFSLFKINAVSAVLNIVSVFFEMTLMVPGLILTSGAVDISGAFYWQYAIPMLIILITVVFMGITEYREKYILSRDTKLLQNALYEKFGEQYETLSAKQIKDFINTFNPYKTKKSKAEKTED